MPRLLLTCKDALMTDSCGYAVEEETFDEAIKKLRLHARILHERDIPDNQVIELKKRQHENKKRAEAAPLSLL